MSTNPKSKIGIIVVVIAIVALAGLYLKKQGGEKNAALPKIVELTKASEVDRQELVDLYQKRIDFLLDWEKAVKASEGKIPAGLAVDDKILKAKEFTPKTENDLNQIDLIQNDVSEWITKYLQSKVAMKKRPPGLEKLEETINRKRHDYHVAAFAANDLITQYDPKAPLIPTFGAEKVLVKQKLWK